MKYDIISAPSYALVEMSLNEGESVIVEPGSMSWMDTTIKPKTEIIVKRIPKLPRFIASRILYSPTSTI